MRKVIDGKIYDTDTADALGTWSNGLPYSDGEYAEATLYRKKNGEFFTHGEGGGLSGYAKPAVGGGTVGGEDITPLTENEARGFAEHLSAGEYEHIFGEMPE